MLHYAFRTLRLLKFNKAFVAFLQSFLRPLINGIIHVILRKPYYVLIKCVLHSIHSNSPTEKGLGLRVKYFTIQCNFAGLVCFITSN